MRDTKTEDWLLRHGVAFHYEAVVKLAELAPVENDREQIRLGFVDEDHIVKLKLAWASGEPIPPLILWKGGVNGKKEAIHHVDGIHRRMMFDREGVKEWDAYFLDKCDEGTIDRLQRQINTMHGKAYTTEEAVQHALYLVDSGRMTLADVERTMFIPAVRVGNEYRARKQRQELIKAGIRSEFKKTNLITIASLSREAHRINLAKIAYKAALTTEEIKEAAREINRAKSDQEAEAVIERIQVENQDRIRQTAGGPIRKVSRFAQAASITAKLNRFLDEAEKQGKGSGLGKLQVRALIESFVKAKIAIDRALVVLRRELKS